jgi:hypothetical protein
VGLWNHYIYPPRTVEFKVDFSRFLEQRFELGLQRHILHRRRRRRRRLRDVVNI